jgi:hypothetical protein
MPDGGRIGQYPWWWSKIFLNENFYNNLLQKLGAILCLCIWFFHLFIVRQPSCVWLPSDNSSRVLTVSNDQVPESFISKPWLRSAGVLTHNQCLTHAQCHAHCSHDSVNEEYEYHSNGSWLSFAHRGSLSPCSACQVAWSHIHNTSIMQCVRFWSCKHQTCSERLFVADVELHTPKLLTSYMWGRKCLGEGEECAGKYISFSYDYAL